MHDSSVFASGTRSLCVSFGGAAYYKSCNDMSVYPAKTLSDVIRCWFRKSIITNKKGGRS